VYAFLGGPRFFTKMGRVVPFAQILTGVAHLRAQVRLTPGIPGVVDTVEDSTTDFALQPGGGLTILLTDRVGVRLAGDYRSIINFAEEENDYTNEFRMIAGFSLQWGGR
jgi:opacity protein-like surface antigen